RPPRHVGAVHGAEDDMSEPFCSQAQRNAFMLEDVVHADNHQGLPVSCGGARDRYALVNAYLGRTLIDEAGDVAATAQVARNHGAAMGRTVENDWRVHCPHHSGQRSLSRRMNSASGSRSRDRKSTRLNSSHVKISYAVF